MVSFKLPIILQAWETLIFVSLRHPFFDISSLFEVRGFYKSQNWSDICLFQSDFIVSGPHTYYGIYLRTLCGAIYFTTLLLSPALSNA